MSSQASPPAIRPKWGSWESASAAVSVSEWASPGPFTIYNDPEIVIFDEATSSLDSVTEGHILQALESLKGVKTLIVIAHRLNTVWDFDEIFVLHQGKLAGQGTSTQLLQTCPTFQRLAQRQQDIWNESAEVRPARHSQPSVASFQRIQRSCSGE